MANQFVHLHLHSEYSLLDSTLRLKPLIAETRKRGMAAIAINQSMRRRRFSSGRRGDTAGTSFYYRAYRFEKTVGAKTQYSRTSDQAMRDCLGNR